MRSKIAVIGIVAIGAAALGGGPDGLPDVSGAKIPNQPVSGIVKGKSFVLRQAVMEADGMSSVQADDNPPDRVRPYKLRFSDHAGWSGRLTIEVRFCEDWAAKLDGQKIVCRPFVAGTPEAIRQQYLGLPGARLPRGITAVNLSEFPKKSGPADSITFKDRISARIEFGKLKNGWLPGRIVLALPDDPRSYILGTFNAEWKVRD